jgi:hypothetical protein
MRLHMANVLRHSVTRLLGSQGTTGLGFLTPFVVSVLSALATAVLLFALKGWGSVLEHFGQNLGIILAGTLIGNVLWFSPIFMWSLVKTVEADHQAQGQFVQKYKSAKTDLWNKGDGMN